MTNHDMQPGVPLDAPEPVLHERFESAVSGLQLDVPSLVIRGTLEGRQLRRRRQLQRLGAGVASLVVIAAGGALGVHGGLFDSKADSPADHGDVIERVPTTARALAAVVIADLPSNVRVLTNGGVAVKGKAVEADLRLTDGAHTADLGLGATTLDDFPTRCSAFGFKDCHLTTLSDGSRLLTSESTQGSDAIQAVLVVLQRGDESLLVVETARTAGGREAILLSSDQLAQMLQDPRFGMQTSQEMVDAGNALPDFLRKADVLGAGPPQSGSSSGSGSVHTVPPPVRHRAPTSTTHT